MSKRYAIHLHNLITLTNEVNSSSAPVLDKPTRTSNASVASVVYPKKPSLPAAAQTSRPTVEDTNIQQTTPKNASTPVVNAQPNQRPTAAKTTQE